MNTTVVIPTLNEEQNIFSLVYYLKTKYPKIKVIISDDNSQDQTQSLAKKAGAFVIDRKNKTKGLTASVLDALPHITTENIIVMDADFQHSPYYVEKINQALQNHQIVIATRQKIIGPWPLHRKLESQLATYLAQLRLKQSIQDPLSGFFGLKTKLFNSIPKKNFQLQGFKVLFSILKNLPQKTKIRQIPYHFHIREKGHSKISKKHIYYFVKNLLT